MTATSSASANCAPSTTSSTTTIAPLVNNRSASTNTQEVAPEAQEVISYNMPAFKQGKILVYFAAFKNHIGFYALPSGNAAFREALSKYKVGKGSIQFPLNQAIPFDLIKEMVAFRLEEIKQGKR